MDLSKFIYKQTLQTNPTQKTICLLGVLKGQQQKGQAIIILTPKIPLPTTDHQQQMKPIFPFTSIQNIFQNDIYSKFQVQFQHSFQIQSIYPITQKQKLKYRRKYKLIQRQTGLKYQSQKQKILQKQLSHIGWVKNIIAGTAQTERVLYQDDNVVLLPDFKFHNLKETQNLHLLCIFKNFELHSLRDLNHNHLPLLETTQSIINELLQKHFNIDISYCRVYFHYTPTFYQLHLHIQSLELNTKTSNVERCHLLSTVIDNIKLMGDYYQRATLNCFKEVEKKEEQK